MWDVPAPPDLYSFSSAGGRRPFGGGFRIYRLLFMKKSLAPSFPDQHDEIAKYNQRNNTDENDVVSEEV